ncbi:MAG: ROK family protein, partial [Lachnospiraceae bacterium]|nr:ROK family protein [Lachnospiraceae bacterium]
KYSDTTCAPFDVLQRLIKECHELIDYDREHEVVAIGVAVPGPYVRKRNRIVMMTGFRDWQEVHIEEELRKEFQIKVYMEHDANVGALSYNWSLGANENRSLIYVAAGQGVGAGIIIGGELFIGTTGTSGEIGHMSIAYDGPLCQCGNRGCLEKYCSSMALTKSLNNKIREGNYTILKEGCSFEDISDAVKQSDRLAVEEYEKACEKLSIGVVNLINAFNPDTIVIGDEIAAVDPELLLKTVQRITEERVLPEILEGTEIIAGKEDNDEILRGAGILAINEMLPDFLSGKRSLPEPEV